MKRAILYVHGKGGSAAEAARFRAVCPGFEVLGVDYRGELPWEAAPQIACAYDEVRRQYDRIILLANSIGAYFAMLALQGRALDQALFVSPVLDMERLILDMMSWAGVSEEALREQGRSSQTLEKPFPGNICAMCGSTPSHGRRPRRSSMQEGTIWCPARAWSGSRQRTAPVSPFWRAASTGSTRRSSWHFWTAGRRRHWRAKANMIYGRGRADRALPLCSILSGIQISFLANPNEPFCGMIVYADEGGGRVCD